MFVSKNGKGIRAIQQAHHLRNCGSHRSIKQWKNFFKGVVMYEPLQLFYYELTRVHIHGKRI